MLTQLSTLKIRLGLELFDTTDDILLTNIIKLVSARIAAECNRRFEYGADLTFEFPGDEIGLFVDHPPIEVVSEFALKSSEAEGWIVQHDVDYLLSPKKIIVSLASRLGTCRQLGRLTYTGGYVLPGSTPTGNQIALPDDIELACVEQAAYWYQRRTQLGLLSISSDAGLVQEFQSPDLLPQLTAVVLHYRRLWN